MTETIEITQLDVGKLTPSPHNPRRELGAADLAELAESIKQLGVLEPILARKSGKGFEILAGHRRHAAAKLAKLPTIPTILPAQSGRLRASSSRTKPPVWPLAP